LAIGGGKSFGYGKEGDLYCKRGRQEVFTAGKN
jgi:hypothetical protein